MITDIFAGVDYPVSQAWGLTDNPVEVHCVDGLRHTGIDIAAPMGTAIHATRNGTVWSVGAPWQLGPFGVVLLTEDGTSLVYGHLNSTAVTTGQAVRVGDVIGWVGTLGVSTGPHLHFEVQPRGCGVFNCPGLDPSTYCNIPITEGFPEMCVVSSPDGKVHVVCPSGKFYIGDPGGELSDWLRSCRQTEILAWGQYTIDRLPELTRLP